MVDFVVRVTLPLLILCSLVLGTGCSDVRLLQPSEVGEYRSLFGPLKAVLAVRNPACIMCHAKIKGDFITDFGYGNQFFMGADQVINHPNQASYYSPFASKHFIWHDYAWQTSSIMGDVYIPNVTVNDPRLIAAYRSPLAGNPPAPNPLPLIDFVNNPFEYLPNGTLTRLIGRSSSPDINEPGLRGNFVARRSVWIDAPSEEEILSLKEAPGAQKLFAELGVVVYKRSRIDHLEGLDVRQSQKTYKLYLTNAPTMTCRGDIIVQGNLFLNNLNLITDDQGCRLYVAGSVFIQGPINYLSGGTSNLQISSSRAVIMGMRALGSRLTQSATPAMVGGIRQGWTDDQELMFNIQISVDRDSIDGLTNDAGPFRKMVDQAGNVLALMDDYDLAEWRAAPGVTSFPSPDQCINGYLPTVDQPCGLVWAEDFQRKSIDYKHLVLNAPKIYSRYYGTFEGVVIAEDALFAVKHFVFAHDPTLDRVTLLPLVQNRVFNLSND